MKTIALRFGEQFAPECGTIAAHKSILNDLGYVWYGQMGSKVSENIIKELLSVEHPKILLIRSGKNERYWACIDNIQHNIPNNTNAIPEYYRDKVIKFKTWFRIIEISPASNDVMSKCIVVSSGNNLSDVSKHSMSPYFIIEYNI